MKEQIAELKVIALPLLLCLLLGMLIILNSTYSDTIFLSTYPKSWLSSYFIAIPISTLVLFVLTNSMIANASEKGAFLIILGIIIILLLTYIIMVVTNLYSVPFILSILTSILQLVIAVISLNALSCAFDIRTYKQHAFKFNLSVIIGCIMGSLLIPLITYLSNNHYIFFTDLFMMLCCGFCLLHLPKLQEKNDTDSETTIETNVFKQSFFINLFLIIILSELISTLITYAFKNSLLGIYTPDKLANFLGIFSGIICLASVFMQLLVAKRLLFLVGLSGVMLLMPGISIILGIGTAISPQFIVLVIMLSVYSIVSTSLFGPCLQMMSNPYPSNLRKKINLYLAGYGVTIAGLTAALIIFIVNTYLNIRYLGFIIAILSCYWIVITYKAIKGYQQTLHDGLKERRYSPDLLNLPPESIIFMQEDIIKALQSQDTTILRTGLVFFQNDLFIKYVTPKTMEAAIAKRLSHPEPDIRYKVTIALKRFHATDYTDALLAQLDRESDALTGFAIIDTLIDFGKLPTAKDAENRLASQQPFQVAYGLLGLEQANTNALQLKKRALLDNLLSGDTHDKITLARIQHYLPVSPEQGHYIEQLINDKTPQVSIEAIKALKHHTSLEFVPMLITRLGIKEISYFAEMNLAGYGDSILNQLLAIDNNNASHLQQQAIIKLLARLTSNLKAIEQLIARSISPNLEQRFLIAQQVLRFFKNQPLTPAVQQAITDMLVWLAREITTLRSLDPANNENVIVEIEIQLSMNRRAFIGWYAVLTNPRRIKDVAHYIEKPMDYPQNEVSKAYELLDSLSSSVELRRVIKEISEPCPETEKITELSTHLHPSIIMLATYQTHAGPMMNNRDKVALLRRVKLFKDILATSLVIIANKANVVTMAKGEIIFKDNDETDRFYCIVSGQVTIQKKGVIFSQLNEADYFGELGLLDSMPRTADAIATTEGILLYIEKEDFLRILDNYPDIMRTVVMQIILYLRQNLERQRA